MQEETTYTEDVVEMSDEISFLLDEDDVQYKMLIFVEPMEKRVWKNTSNFSWMEHSKAAVVTLHEYTPVSYTHLDVYKRQQYELWTVV